MIMHFYKLTPEERSLLYRVPVLISVLASCFCANQKRPNAEAVRSAYLKTFTVNPLLFPYYSEVEKSFIGIFESAIKQYFPFVEPMRMSLLRELTRANRAIGKLDRVYAQALHQSLEKYASHVKTITDTVCVDLLSDGCADMDKEVHRVLISKVFPLQAGVVSVEEWVEGGTPGTDLALV